MSAANVLPKTARKVYRALLRELPPRPLYEQPPAPLHNGLRQAFEDSAMHTDDKSRALAVLQQTAAYFRSQRKYVMLVERYNPGMIMSQDERIRLSARRVGLNLPQGQPS